MGRTLRACCHQRRRPSPLRPRCVPPRRVFLLHPLALCSCLRGRRRRRRASLPRARWRGRWARHLPCCVLPRARSPTHSARTIRSAQSSTRCSPPPRPLCESRQWRPMASIAVEAIFRRISSLVNGPHVRAAPVLPGCTFGCRSFSRALQKARRASDARPTHCASRVRPCRLPLRPPVARRGGSSLPCCTLPSSPAWHSQDDHRRLQLDAEAVQRQLAPWAARTSRTGSARPCRAWPRSSFVSPTLGRQARSRVWCTLSMLYRSSL